MTTLLFKTNLNCGSCVAAVKPHLDGDPTITRWDVDVSSPEKILSVSGDSVSAHAVTAAVAKAGFKVLGEVVATPPPAQSHGKESPSTYFPLILLGGFLFGAVGLIEVADGHFVWDRAMRHFMGAFFLSFSFFKLLDLRGFADSFRMYDVAARRVPAYGYVYPFVELLLGAAYLTEFQPLATNLVTLLVMTVGAAGVIQSLRAKRKIRCACLGTVFNLPMSTVTLVEDALMIAMAAIMLFSMPHSGRSAAENPIQDSEKGPAPMKNHHEHAGGHRSRTAGASLQVHTESLPEAGQPSVLHTAIRGPDGETVKNFDALHGAEIHLIIVREGLDTFAHLHPEIGAGGNLIATYKFPSGGTYRLYADFREAGKPQATLSTTVRVTGDAPPAPALVPNVPGRVEGDDGLKALVALQRVGVGREAELRFELFDSEGRPIRELSPYLGALGHLVVIGAGGGEYVHAHPQERGPDDVANSVVFHASFPGGGVYKGWGQFKHGTAIHVVPFVVQMR